MFKKVVFLLKEKDFKESTKKFPGIMKVLDRLKWDPAMKGKEGDFNIGLKSAYFVIFYFFFLALSELKNKRLTSSSRMRLFITLFSI